MVLLDETGRYTARMKPQDLQTPDQAARHRNAVMIMLIAPLFFSSNLIIGRAAVDAVSPATLACLRWTVAAMTLLPFAIWDVGRHSAALKAAWRDVLLLACLGMVICGAGVYLSLHFTTATNATLIYATSPVMIVVLELVRRTTSVSLSQSIGIALALLGVATIVFNGSIADLLAFRLNVGDLGIAIAALSWAIYSVRLPASGLQTLPTLALFTVIAGAGAALLSPLMIAEIAVSGSFPLTAKAWLSIIGVAIVPSVLAFSCYQFGVKVLGASMTGTFMYLMPAYGVLLSVIFLGERLELFHIAAMMLIAGGLVLTTRPWRAWRSSGRAARAMKTKPATAE